MKIKLDQIKPSPHPIRTSWDEERMDELAQSIKMQGLIVPIKVRPTDDEHYEIVYGHRRTEACRRAGLLEIEAIVEGLDDTSTMVNALLENIQREDLDQVDEASALLELKELVGWTDTEIADGLGKSEQWVGQRILLAKDEVAKQVSTGAGTRDLPYKAQQARGAFGDDDELRKEALEYIVPKHERDTREALKAIASVPDRDAQLKILRKAKAKDYTPKETASLARAAASADDEYTRRQVLSIDPHGKTAREITAEAHSKVMGKLEEYVKEKRQKQLNDVIMSEWDSAVKDFLVDTRNYKSSVGLAKTSVQYGRFSPEAKRFTTLRLEELIKEINGLLNSLKEA